MEGIWGERSGGKKKVKIIGGGSLGKRKKGRKHGGETGVGGEVWGLHGGGCRKTTKRTGNVRGTKVSKENLRRFSLEGVGEEAGPRTEHGLAVETKVIT